MELEAAIKKYGCKGQFQHLSQWTWLDIQTATQRLAQYQNAPGQLHFDALVQIAKYLWVHPDLPCSTKITTTPLPLLIGLVAGSGSWLGDMTIWAVEAHHFGGSQTFWPDNCDIGSISACLTLSLGQKHSSSGPPPITGFADANFGGALFDQQASIQWWHGYN